MKLKYKLTIWAIVIDLLLYFLLFHSGVTLPFINPSPEEYAQQFTSFPRNAMQLYIWLGLHLPTSYIVDLSFSNELLGLSVIQTGVIFFGIGAFIDRRREKNGKK